MWLKAETLMKTHHCGSGIQSPWHASASALARGGKPYAVTSPPRSYFHCILNPRALNHISISINCHGQHQESLAIGCVTGYQVIRVIRIFAKTYPFE